MPDETKRLKLAVLGDVATQFLIKGLKKEGPSHGLMLELYEAPYDQVERSIADRRSELYQFGPEVIVIVQSSEKLLEAFYLVEPEERAGFGQRRVAQIGQMLEQIEQFAPGSQVVVANYVELEDGVLGNFANSWERSFIYQVRTVNLGLMNFAQANRQLSIIDLSTLQNRLGRGAFYDPRFYVSSSVAHSMEAGLLIARNICDVIAARQGLFKKCVVLDLDNTLWGGIIGDDGLEKIEIGALGQGKGFTLLQKWLKELKRRGILLAVCSKNEEQVAREPFLKHPEMVLRLEDVAVFVANWQNKAENIRSIQKQLNIGLDSMVFLDDNPFERSLVKSALPEVTVPELPAEPSDYLGYLQSLNLFETAGVSENDAVRTQHIQDKIKLDELKANFVSEAEFLQSLQMVLRVAPFEKFNTPRVAQLSQRSNQFNLRTVRYSEEEVKRLAASSTELCLALSLSDNLADHGLISVLVLNIRETELFIENWFMSCRVLKRGVEQATLNHLVEVAKHHHKPRLVGEYLPTKKNGMVEKHYEGLGFTALGEGRWSLEIGSYQPLENFIRIEVKG